MCPPQCVLLLLCFPPIRITLIPFQCTPEPTMKIALDRIADYLTPTPDADRAADALMNAGLPVESITDAMGSKGPTKVLDVEVTSNRTDCFSHVGLARELAVLTGGNFSPPTIEITETAPPASTLTSVTIEKAPGSDPGACSYYS